MRTPLSNLMGHTQQTLRKVRSVEEYENLLASNQEEYERLARMIDSMLFLARSEQAGAVIAREAIDLEVMAARLADYFEGMAEERGIVFALRASGVMQADHALVQRAMANLVANALRYGSPNSTVTIAGSVGAHGAELRCTTWASRSASSISRICSNASTGAIQPAATVATPAGWGWRSCGPSCSCTAAG